VAPSQLALIVVGRAELPGGVWLTARRPLVAPGGETIGVYVSDQTADAFAALFETSNRQWRTGAATRSITFEGPAGSFLVGSGPDFSDWDPTRALALPVTLMLPISGAFEFKALRRDGAHVTWAEGPNGVIFVEPQGADRVVVSPTFR